MIFSKDEVLRQLKHDTYVTLRPSSIEGIGVFAIRKIPKGCRDMFPVKKLIWHKIPEDEIWALEPAVVEPVQRYFVHYEGHFFVADTGFKYLCPLFYLNHSETPNIVCINDGDEWEAIRDIEVGEELTLKYETLDDLSRADVFPPAQ